MKRVLERFHPIFIITLFTLALCTQNSFAQSDSTLQVPIKDAVKTNPKIKKIHPKTAFAGDTITIQGERFDSLIGRVILSQDQENPEIESSLKISSWTNQQVQVILPAILSTRQYDIKVCKNKTCSNGKSLEIKKLNWRKIFHFGFGGVAIFIIGLALLKSGFKSIGSVKLKRMIQFFSRTDFRIIGASAFFTFILQSPSSFAYFVIGLIEVEAIQLSHAVLFSLGSHIGGSLIGFLLHFNIVQNSLFIVLIGMLLRAFFKGRREFHPTINAFLGFGMLLYGAHLIKNGFAPLAFHPESNTIVSSLDSLGFAQYYVMGLIGALLTILLGSSSIVLIIIITLAQTSTALDFYNSFAIVCGMPIGSSIALYWHTRTKSLDSRQTAILQLVIHVSLWVIWGLFSKPYVNYIEILIPHSVDLVDNDSKIIFPQMALHISSAYLLYLLYVLLFGWLISNRLWLYIRNSKIGQLNKPLTSVYGVEFCDETHFGEKEQEELQKVKHVIGILNQKTMECFELIGNPQHTNHKYFYRLRRELKEARMKIQSLLLQYKGHSPDKKVNKELDIWMSFIFEYQKLYKLFIYLFKSELEISQIPGDDFERDVTRKLRMRKYLIKNFHILSDIIENPESQDLSEAQFFEIEINRTERRAHRKALKAVGTGEIDSQAASFFLQSFSLHEQIGNILYRCCYELLATKRVNS